MTKIYNRTKERFIRKQLRNRLTETEVILWSQLKDKQFHNMKFRRQYSIGPFVVDFYAPRIKLAIEVDGESHLVIGEPEKDKEREQWIRQYGITFLRFTNDEIKTRLNEVLRTIVHTISSFNNVKKSN